MPTYKDEKGKWYCKFYTGLRRPDGTREQKKKSGFARKKDADQYERDYLRKMTKSPSMTLADLVERYFEDKAGRIKPTTAENRKRRINNHILPYLGDKRLDSITPLDIVAWQNAEKEKVKSAYTLKVFDNTLAMLFNHACKFYNLDKSPYRSVDRVGEVKHSLNFWTLNQYQAFMAIPDLKDPGKTMIETLFFSGLRIGELLGLCGTDLDFDANTINVNKQLVYVGKEWIEQTPKTKNGIRLVTMPPSVMADIKAYTGRMYGYTPENRVFPFKDGPVRYAIHQHAAAASVPIIRIHDLRHSHVSLLIEQGYSAQLIAERIGDTTEMVMHVYGHLYPDRHKEVADTLEKLNHKK